MTVALDSSLYLCARLTVGVRVNVYDREMERLVTSMNMSGCALCKIMYHAGLYCHHESLII